MLTVRSKVTGQKAREIPAKETKLLKDFANSFDEDDATGEKIQQELADIAVKRWDKKLSTDKIKSLVDKYKQPQNCSDIKTIKVNPEIWNQMSSTKRETDLKISNLQQIIRKITFATLQTTNMPALQKEEITEQRQEIMAQLLQIKSMVSGFTRFLPRLLNYLQNLCATFKAGQVAAHFAAWRTLMTKYFCLMFWKQVLNVLLPLPNIDCLIKPFPSKTIVSQEVQKLLDKGVIRKASPRAGQILSSIFLRP